MNEVLIRDVNTAVKIMMVRLEELGKVSPADGIEITDYLQRYQELADEICENRSVRAGDPCKFSKEVVTVH